MVFVVLPIQNWNICHSHASVSLHWVSIVWFGDRIILSGLKLAEDQASFGLIVNHHAQLPIPFYSYFLSCLILCFCLHEGACTTCLPGA